jgi:hypothetical protein
MFNKFISFPLFLTSLAIGLLFVYLLNPTPTTIFVYPTPDNEQLVQYVDKTKNCFQFEHEEVTCPENKTEIKNIPFQN